MGPAHTVPIIIDPSTRNIPAKAFDEATVVFSNLPTFLSVNITGIW